MFKGCAFVNQNLTTELYPTFNLVNDRNKIKVGEKKKMKTNSE